MEKMSGAKLFIANRNARKEKDLHLPLQSEDRGGVKTVPKPVLGTFQGIDGTVHVV